MGVDFLVCDHCSDTFPDCGHYVECDCGGRWCSDGCAEEDGLEQKEEYEEEGYWYDGEKSCKYCRHEDATNSTLFSFLLTQCHLTRGDVLKLWQTSLISPREK